MQAITASAKPVVVVSKTQARKATVAAAAAPQKVIFRQSVFNDPLSGESAPPRRKKEGCGKS